MLYRSHLVILGLKKTKKRIFGSDFQDVRRQKMLKTPIFGLFWGSKGYWGVCHIYIRKVTKFGLTKIINFRSNCDFLVGGGVEKEEGRVIFCRLRICFLVQATTFFFSNQLT